MPLEDIYRADFNYQAPDSIAMVSMYYFEDVQASNDTNHTRALAVALLPHMSLEIVAALSTQWRFVGVDVQLMYDQPQPKWREDELNSLGTRPGPALPANNAMLLAIMQSTQGARSNGRLFIPGIPEADTVIGQLTSTYVTSFGNPLADKFKSQVAEDSGGLGRWTPIMISPKIRDANPPFKDWPNAVMTITGITTNPVIATQRRRTTKVRSAITAPP